MADRVGNLAIVISADANQFNAVMTGVEDHIRRMNSKNLGGAESKFGIDAGQQAQSFARYAKAAAVGFLGSQFIDIGRDAIKMARDFEVSETQLKSLTGSAGQAKAVFDELRTFSSGTPFETTDVSSVARKLMGSGVNQAQAMKATKEITTVAAGTGGDLMSLGRAYSQVKSNGRFMTEELNQFADADFPIQEFAKTFGKSMAEMRADMEKGLVPVSVMSDTFTRLTTAGGIFEKSLQDMAGTAAGQAKMAESAHQAKMAVLGAEIDKGPFSLDNAWRWIKKEAAQVQAGLSYHYNDMGAGTTATRDWHAEVKSNQDQLAQIKKIYDARAEKDYRAGVFEENAPMVLSDFVDKLKQSVKAVSEFSLRLDKETMNPFRSGAANLNDPAFGGFRESMRTNDFDSAAKQVQDMRTTLANRDRVVLPQAATYGSAAASATIDNAIASALGGPMKTTEEVLKAMKTVEDEQEKHLDAIKQDLRKLKAVRI